jgi:hypothetical protein
MNTVTTAATGRSYESAKLKSIIDIPGGRLTRVRRNRQQVRMRAGQTGIQLLDDRRQEQRECVERTITAHVNDCKRPRLPVLD